MDQTTDDPAKVQDLPPSADRNGLAGWLARIEEVGEDAGYFQSLGSHHWAFFVDESPTLLVTFETVESIRAGSSDQLPLGYALAQKHGWSHLCIIADGETWYRDPAVFRYFDRLVDDAFFEDFDDVTFYGAGMCGYAACAYSVAAPQATVLALQPVATLDPAVAGWDVRFRSHRRLCFTDRYGFAPDMTEGAGEVYVIHDPTQPLDAMHAALFARPHVTQLRCRNLGTSLEFTFEKLGILSDIIEAAVESTLGPTRFARFLRKRRNHVPYLRELMEKLEKSDRHFLSAVLSRNVSDRMKAPYFRKKLAALTEEGISLPPRRVAKTDA